MSRQMKRPVYAGCTLDIEVMACTDPKSGKIRDAKPKLRFKDEAERVAHRMGMALRRFIRKFNATFRAGDLYATLTFDDDHEVHTFKEARRVRDAFWRRLRRAYPQTVMVIVMGRGKSTSRIHMHLVTQGVPEEAIRKAWVWGMVLEPIRVLRGHNYYVNEDGEKADRGADFRGLATYLFNHWTEEQGGHYYKGTRNMTQPEPEEPTEVKRKYTADKPPRAPKGYLYIGSDQTPYGYACYHYVIDPGGASGKPRPT